MEISTVIATSIHDLLHDLDPVSDGSSLQEPLAALGRHLTAAVHSFVGLELTLHAHGQPFTLRCWASGAQAAATASSLHLPVSALLTPEHRGGFSFWAAEPGAFVDLAADLTYVLALAPGTIRLDEHLHQLPAGDGLFGLAAAAALNQAIGALIAAGHGPEAARRHLEEAAGANGVTLEEQAHRLLADLR